MSRHNDEMDCCALLLRAAHFADHHDVEAFVALFTDDGWVERLGERFIGTEAIRGFFQGRNTARRTRHVPSPPLITFRGPDEAAGLALFTLFDGIESDDQAVLPVALPATVGEFHQEYRRTENGWKIASHRSVAVFRRA